MIAWYEAKRFLSQSTGVSMDALHVLGGIVLLLGFAAILRRPISDPRPFLAVLALALLNEASDVWTEIWPDHWLQFREGAKDVVVTMLVPSILLVTARLLPCLFVGAPRVRSAPVEGGQDAVGQAAGARSPTAS